MPAAATAVGPTNFFAHQAEARRRTTVLLVYYVLAVLATMFAVYCVTRAVFIFTFERNAMRWHFIHPAMLAWTSAATFLVIAGGSLLRLLELRSGGRGVAEMMGGALVLPSPHDPALQQLRNVVEEISIASGVPAPEVYVLERERGINAFAAGYSIEDAAIAVTRGALNHLTRDELQGVIAHEFSHILNGDMRLNIHMLALLHGLFGVYLAGRLLVEFSCDDRPRERANPVFALLVFGFLLIAVGYLGVMMARVIQAAVSRQREFLADASAVQFTRNPLGLCGALKKIGGFSRGSRLRNGQADAVSHFLFANGIADSWTAVLATHPPLDARIRKLDPAFDGRFPRIQDDNESESVCVARVAAHAGVAADWKVVAAAPLIRANALSRGAGQMMPVRYAAGVLDSIPSSLRAATGSSWSATALVFAFLLGDGETRAQQLQQIAAFNEALAAETKAYGEQLRALDIRARLPLVSLCVSALRQLSREQWQQINGLLDELVACDKQVELFEFVVKKIVERHVDFRWNPREAAVVQYYSFTPLVDDFGIVLSALANCGSTSSDEVRASFTRGVGKLPMFDGVRLLPIESCGVGQLDHALSRFAQAVPHIKKTLLDACAEAVAADGLVNVHEAELLRGIADALGVPIPPLIQGV
jgi:Zn-dependent protease with chaperone function